VPTPRPPHAKPTPEIAGVVRRNIRVLGLVRDAQARKKPPAERFADAITGFTGSIWSAGAHAALFGGWIVVNTGVVPGVRPFDPFPFVMLAMFASVEAIFLTTFVLMSQNRMGKLADERANLDVQVNLLSEHEITRVLHVLHAIAKRLDVPVPAEELSELERDVPPEAVLEEIQRAEDEET
jgi:uncharacterized membrane protein